MKELYEQFYSPMMNVVLRYTRSQEEAKDLVHDGFIKVYKNIGNYRIGSSLYSWIKRIMINTAIDHIRREKRRRTDDVEEHRELSNSEVDVLSLISETELLKMVQSLSPSYRAVFNLYIIEGYSHREKLVKHSDVQKALLVQISSRPGDKSKQ